MSRVDHWRIHKLCKGKRMKSGTLGNARHKVHKLEWNNKRKMLGKPMLRRVHLVRARIQYGKKILNGMYMYGGKNNEN